MHIRAGENVNNNAMENVLVSIWTNLIALREIYDKKKVSRVFQPLPEQNCLCTQYFRGFIMFDLLWPSIANWSNVQYFGN